MRWLIVLPFDRPGLMGVEFATELAARGHATRRFAYRRDDPLYKNRSTKPLYQRWILRALVRVARAWQPDVVLVIKGGPITPETVAALKAGGRSVVLNVFPDNPLWMMPFECIEAYDLFFTKERYALRALQQAGLRNLYYLPPYCVPDEHHPVTLTAAERQRYAAAISFVGNRYPYRERFLRELADYPLRVWGRGWTRARDPAIRRLVAGEAVFGRPKLCVYSGSTLALNHHHPMNDIAGVNTRTFELAAAGACQVVDFKEELAALFKPGQEVLAYRDLDELRHLLDVYLARPDEARAIGANARARALAEHTVGHRLDEILAALRSRLGT